MKIYVYFYQTDEYGDGDAFVNADGHILGVVNENDGDWRHEYFNPIFANAGVTIVDGGCFTEDHTRLYSKLKSYFGD